MIANEGNQGPAEGVLALSVGNTRAAWGVGTSAETVEDTDAMALGDPQAIAAAVAALSARWGDAPVVVVSVNDPDAQTIESFFSDELLRRTLRVGRDIVAPIEIALPEDHTTGQDRLLAAAAAFDILQQACVVIDAGTAVTVDFVDGAGVYQGGAIAPGARLMFTALHEHTASLPLIEHDKPDPAQPFAKATEESIRTGVHYALRGLVRSLVERYAEAYEAYPQVVATGGDAHALFGDDEFVESIVPDLTLRGAALAFFRASQVASAADDEA